MWLVKGQFTDPAPKRAPDTDDSFSAPTRDHAYDFDVVVYCTTSSKGRRRFRLWMDERDEAGRVYEIIRETVWRTAREFSIFEPGQAEQAINNRLRERLEQATRSDSSITRRWTARAEVTLPDEVRSLMRTALSERYGIEMKADADALQIAKTNDLRLCWERFLNDAATSSSAQYAITLAENPRDIAGTLEAMLADRDARPEHLLKIISQIIDAHRSAGILNLVVESETVLRKTLDLLGIELPPIDPGTYLVPDDL